MMQGGVSRRGTPHVRPMRIFTIGYEKATQTEVIDTLAGAGVERLIDIRAVPLSRRPGFSKTILARGLAERGVEYIHLKALGTPPEGREAARNGRHDVLARVYAGQLALPEAVAQSAMLLDLAAEKPSALLCFEREPAACHRSLLLSAIAEDAEIIHLFPGVAAEASFPRLSAHLPD